MVNSLPRYKAPSDGRLTTDMVSAYREAGALILEGFVTVESCAALQQRALELVDDFDPETVRTVFSSASDEHQSE